MTKLFILCVLITQIVIGYTFTGEIKEKNQQRNYIEVKVQDGDEIRNLQLYTTKNKNFIRNYNIGDEIIIDIKDGEFLWHYHNYSDDRFEIKLKPKQ